MIRATLARAPLRTSRLLPVRCFAFASPLPKPGSPLPSPSDPEVHRGEIRKPSVEEAKAMPRYFCEMSNHQLLILAADGTEGAVRERMVRDVMATDEIDWDEASLVVDGMAEFNKSGDLLMRLPYQVGIFTAVSTGIGSIPMVFNLELASWFNNRYVTAEIPQPEDVNTWLEVGGWTWNWMEPVLGTASFTLLAFQFSRALLVHCRIKPYNDWILSMRANRLEKKYDHYTGMLVRQFSKAQPFMGR
mmetsp:Transcript_13138/g.29176  ORF Transcript_13138/g.29176 Transcript_13138/m.29176 type:complete len:246 (-) Transcript_13138:189-926(-)